MYFLLVVVAGTIHQLHYGLAVILIFIGGEMWLIDFYKAQVCVSLGVVAYILAVTL